MSSRSYTIRDRRTASRLTVDSPRRRLLLSFVPRARSIAEAAEGEGIPIGRMHYFVRDLVRRGLLRVEREQKRAGRAVRYYRAVADRFVIPLEFISASPGVGLAAELRRCLDQELSRSEEAGIVFFTDELGQPRASWFGKRQRRRPVAEFWHMPVLNDEQARHLIDEIGTVLAKYDRASTKGRPFLIHAAVVPRLLG